MIEPFRSTTLGTTPIHDVSPMETLSDSGYFHIDLLNYLVNTPVSAMGLIRKFITNEQLLLLVQQLCQLHFICWKYFFNLPSFTGTDPKIPEYHERPRKT